MLSGMQRTSGSSLGNVRAIHGYSISAESLLLIFGVLHGKEFIQYDDQSRNSE